MKKISVLLLCPLFLNIMTFMRRFLYDSILMFFISFMIFFVSLYVDFDKDRNMKKKWGLITALVFYVSAVLFVCDTEVISRLTLVVASVPAAAGLVTLAKWMMKSEPDAQLTVKPN